MGATESKPYSAAASDVYAGQETFVTVSITNEASPQTLGSADITVPEALNIGYPSPRVIELRNLDLAPGATYEETIPVRAQCTSTIATWDIQVKQSNDFNGVGNDFVLQGDPATTDVMGDCSLEFTTPPADTERDQVITGDPFYYEDPGVLAEPFASLGTPLSRVTVTVLDGSGLGTVTWWVQPVTLSLGTDPSGGTATPTGTTAVAQAGGVAEFEPALDTSAAGYTLAAATSGLPTVESRPFDIVDDADFCAAGSSCTATSSRNRTTASITASEGSTDIPLTVSVDPADLFVFLDAAACQGYEGTSGTVQFLVADPARSKEVAITIESSLVDKPLKKFEVCFAAPFPFTTKDGTQALPLTDEAENGITIEGLQIYAGLLPDCELPAPGPPGTNEPPCVVSRDRDKTTKDVTLTFVAPADPNDPWGKI
jgi:hypothetical protein